MAVEDDDLIPRVQTFHQVVIVDIVVATLVGVPAGEAAFEIVDLGHMAHGLDEMPILRSQ